ncbi:MAG: hypothetical protein KGJ13_00860 [Patescibacteria group bacterium]|nr:hypothetical protein [Patescibacteria group bacterium]
MLDYLISRFNSFTLGSDITAENLRPQIKRNFKYIPASKIIIICLPGWGGKLNKWKFLEKYASGSRASFLAYEFPRGIFSDQKDRTRELFEEVNTFVRDEIKNLKDKYKFEKCILVCISLASSYGSLIYKDNPDINEIILVAPGEDIAKDMWHGCRTQHFRKSYEKQGFNEAQLIEAWSGLASKNNFPTRGAKIKILLGRSDGVIPYEFSHVLVEIYKQFRLNVVERTFPLGHYFLISYFLLLPGHFLQL